MIARKVFGRRAAVRVIVVLMSSLTATLVVWAAVRDSVYLYPNAPNQTKTNYVEKLEELRQRYAAIRSVHMVADAQITLYGTNFRIGKGSYEYWAEGDRYKIKCQSDKHLEFLPDVDIAYDGSQFYRLDRASRILSYQQQDVSKTIGALPNPLFLPVNFLSIEDDDCRFCGLRMTDFKSHSARWYDRAARLEVRSQRKEPNSIYNLTDLEMPGGTKAKRAVRMQLRIAETGDGRVRTTRIDEVSPDGRVLTSLTFDNFFATALGEFPRTISLEVFDERSNILVRMIYSVKTLELDQPIEKNVFAISFEEAETVWDSDGRRLVKEKPPKKLRQ